MSLIQSSKGKAGSVKAAVKNKLSPAKLVKAKIQGPLRVYHLIAHAGIHGAVVLLVTGSVVLGFAEWFLHALIDEAKTRRKISFAQDQALHLLCKFCWLIVSLFLLTA